MMGIGNFFGQAVSEGMDLAFQGARDKLQQKHIRHVNQENWGLEKEKHNWYTMMSDLQREKYDHSYNVKKMQEAGLNVGLMLSGGAGGAGGATQPIKGGEPSAAHSPAVKLGKNIGIEALLADAQIENIKADTEKKREEAENIRGGSRDNLIEDARNKKFDNDLREKYKHIFEEAKRWEWDTTSIKGEEANAAWEFKKAIDYSGGDVTDVNSRAARARIAELKIFEEDLRKAKAEGDVKEAEAIIKDFEAKLTESGISPNAPWYAKLIMDLLTKVKIW